MPSDSAPGPERDAQSGAVPSGAESGSRDDLPLRPWGLTERNHLLIWLAIAFIAPAPILLLLQIPLKPAANVFTIQGQLPSQAIGAFLAVFATWLVARIEKRPLADYGAPARGVFGIRFFEGLVWGFATLSVILLILHLTGHFQIDAVALQGQPALRYGLLWGLVFLGVALHEEFAFRGYLLFSFSWRWGFWRSAVMLSLLFGAVHLANPGENFLGILQVVMIGLIWCLTIRRTGTLWFAVGFHAAWDWAETFFYGTPDSGMLGVGRLVNSSVQGPSWLTGGSAGPEGSIIIIPVFLLLALLVHLRFPKAVYPDHPAQTTISG